MHFAYTIHEEFSEVLNISLFHGKSKTKEEINIQGDGEARKFCEVKIIE